MDWRNRGTQKPLSPRYELYDNETDEQFTARCFRYITGRFADNGLTYQVSNDSRSFKLSFEEEDGTFVNHNIETFYNSGKRIIMFHTIVTNYAIPDNKLIEASELVNRLNDTLMVKSLVLNYEFRIVESSLIYLIGRHEIIDDYFDSYYNTMFFTGNLYKPFKKIVDGNENPALVALEWFL